MFGRPENARAAYEQFIVEQNRVFKKVCVALHSRGMPTDGSYLRWCLSFYRGAAEVIAPKYAGEILAHASEADVVARNFPQGLEPYPQYDRLDLAAVEIGRREGV
jgi:hypothetical protein